MEFLINTFRFFEIVTLMTISLVLQNVVNAKRIDKMAGLLFTDVPSVNEHCYVYEMKIKKKRTTQYTIVVDAMHFFGMFLNLLGNFNTCI